MKKLILFCAAVPLLAACTYRKEEVNERRDPDRIIERDRPTIIERERYVTPPPEGERVDVHIHDKQ